MNPFFLLAPLKETSTKVAKIRFFFYTNAQIFYFAQHLEVSIFGTISYAVKFKQTNNLRGLKEYLYFKIKIYDQELFTKYQYLQISTMMAKMINSITHPDQYSTKRK